MEPIYKPLLSTFCFPSSFLIQHSAVKESWLRRSLPLRTLQGFPPFESLALSERELQQSKVRTASTVMKNQTLTSLDVTHPPFDFSPETSGLPDILPTTNNIPEQYIDCIPRSKKKERRSTEPIYAGQPTDCP